MKFAFSMLLALASTCVPCLASNLTYTFAGIASGSVGNQAFTGASFTVSVSADPTGAVFNSPVWFLYFPANTAIISIGGIGSGLLLEAGYLFDNQAGAGGMVGFGSSNDLIQIRDDAFNSTAFATYDLTTTIGPLGVVSNPSIGDWTNIPTSLGLVNLTSHDRVTFQASGSTSSVPEPSSALLAIPALLLLAIRRK